MLRSLTARRTLPVALLAAGALFLAGCGSDDPDTSADDPTETPSASPTGVADDDGDGCTDFDEGGASGEVTVSGKFGAVPTVTFTKPLEATDLERTVVTEGSGATTKKDDEVNARVTAFKGSDGTALGSRLLPVVVGDSSTLGAFAAGVDCVPLKSRVVVTVGAEQLYGPSGNPEVGIEPDDSIIIVTDVIGKVVPLKPAAWTDPRVKVTFGAEGKAPKLTLPPGAPSQKLQLKILKQGDGAVVGKNDQVTVDYQGTNWRTKKIFDQSYGKQPATFSPQGVVEGFGAALVGQKVGTQLVVTIPAKYGYGSSGNEAAGINGTDVLVFVLEIKETQAG